MTYLYYEPLSTIFFLEDYGGQAYLSGVPVRQDGTFDLSESFEAEETDEFIDDVSIKDMYTKIMTILKGQL